jgi:hypothetical protein
MGGYGSGSWRRLNRKATVEESFILHVENIGTIQPGTTGTLHWRKAGRPLLVHYSVTGDAADLALALTYSRHNAEVVNLVVDLEALPTSFGGRRWWMRCPGCQRRSGKLYLSPRARTFGCRACQNLTYRSCQQANRTARILDRLGFSRDAAKLLQRLTRF